MGMIIDSMTNKVSFSKEIVYYQCWKDLEPLLQQKKIAYSFIENTKDLWVRDFMPIQIYYDKFVRFIYNPDYLQDKKEYLTDQKLCTHGMAYPIKESNINLDGGNVIKCDNCVIMTDKVVCENKNFQFSKLLVELEDIFNSEIIIIPRDVYDGCGHADGMLRYLGENRLLLNHYSDFDKRLRKELIRILSPRFELVELHYQTDKYLSTSWAYLNYLHLNNCLFIPIFENKLDDIALKQIESYTRLEIYPIHCKSTVKIGGGLNCLSWTIKE